MDKRPSNKSNRTIIFFSTALTILLIISAGLFYHLYKSRPRIAYVRTLELVYGYNGMKRAHADFKQQTTAWQSNIDTLRINYERSLSKYQQNLPTLSAKEKEEQQALLKRMEFDLNNYASVIEGQAKEQEQSLTESVLNQINSYVESYAKKQGYDLVLGAEGSGSIVYAADAYDITKEVLSALNEEHKIPATDTMQVSLKP
ncbi:MAG: OmpH family outer membrane protein [Sphingobacteriales bacterium]|nr:MAG: OmpH family outer membrane protein [Sphingobacteriales bacterium]